VAGCYQPTGHRQTHASDANEAQFYPLRRLNHCYSSKYHR
jgi:hypothetical protein